MRVGDSSVRDGQLMTDPSPSVGPAKTRSAARVGAGVVDPNEELSPFAKILRGLGREVDRGEAVVARAVGGAGQDLGNVELLALQAGVYRYSEAVDLSAKLVDRATSGVKTVLQGQ
jgi:hypothetical protein